MPVNMISRTFSSMTKFLRQHLSRLRGSYIFGLAILITLVSPELLPTLPYLHVLRRKVAILCTLPLAIILDLVRFFERQSSRQRLYMSQTRVRTKIVDETQFIGTDYIGKVITKLHSSGLRSTASKQHEEFIEWVEQELADVPGLKMTSDKYEILRWQTLDGQALHESGTLLVHDGLQDVSVPLASVVPYSKPTLSQTGQMEYVPLTQTLSSSAFQNKVLLRELPNKTIPMILGSLPSYSKSKDLCMDYFSEYNRPSFWELAMHKDLIDAGNVGAAGVVFLADLPRSQMISYWDPHQGTHYHVPAVICASEDISMLKAAAAEHAISTIGVRAEISKATTRNIHAVLPGQITETVIYATHTDGNTCVQDNGVAGLLSLARYFASQPNTSRYRSLQFSFNTAHLHVSQEGSGRHATQLDEAFEDTEAPNPTALIIPVEHLGTRELEAVADTSSIVTSRRLQYTGRGEFMIWCVGPSPPLVTIVEDAVARRGLDRTIITRGVGLPRRSLVPAYASFGGLGTLYHNSLLPTTSIISGPWSLFAPSFGPGAVDLNRLRQQTLALGDVYLGVEKLTRDQIASGYLKYRERRRVEKDVYQGFPYPPETLHHSARVG